MTEHPETAAYILWESSCIRQEYGCSKPFKTLNIKAVYSRERQKGCHKHTKGCMNSGCDATRCTPCLSMLMADDSSDQQLSLQTLKVFLLKGCPMIAFDNFWVSMEAVVVHAL